MSEHTCPQVKNSSWGGGGGVGGGGKENGGKFEKIELRRREFQGNFPCQ